MLPAVKAEREGVHLRPELSDLEMIGNKLKQVCCEWADLSRAGFCLISEKWAMAKFSKKDRFCENL